MVGAHQSYQFFENNSWFYRNKELCQMFNLISIIKFEQNEPIKANLILIMQANFIVCFNVILFILMALTYIGTVKLPM